MKNMTTVQPKLIDWDRLDPADPNTVTEISLTATSVMSLALAEAGERHRKAGRPIFYLDDTGRLVKEMPDGRRIAVDDAGSSAS
jgi:hypothetical protein